MKVYRILDNIGEISTQSEFDIVREFSDGKCIIKCNHGNYTPDVVKDLNNTQVRQFIEDNYTLDDDGYYIPK